MRQDPPKRGRYPAPEHAQETPLKHDEALLNQVVVQSHEVRIPEYLPPRSHDHYLPRTRENPFNTPSRDPHEGHHQHRRPRSNMPGMCPRVAGDTAEHIEHARSARRTDSVISGEIRKNALKALPGKDLRGSSVPPRPTDGRRIARKVPTCRPGHRVRRWWDSRVKVIRFTKPKADNDPEDTRDDGGSGR